MPGSLASDFRVAHGLGLARGHEDAGAHRLRHVAVADEDHLPREIPGGEHERGDAHGHADTQAPAPRKATRRAQRAHTGSAGADRARGSLSIAFRTWSVLFIARIEGTPPRKTRTPPAVAAARFMSAF